MVEGTSDPAVKAHAFREGFIAGVRATLKAIGDDLPEEQSRVLEKWASGPLERWSKAGPDADEPPMPMVDGA